jgi:hypothetical protein
MVRGERRNVNSNSTARGKNKGGQDGVEEPYMMRG